MPNIYLISLQYIFIYWLIVIVLMISVLSNIKKILEVCNTFTFRLPIYYKLGVSNKHICITILSYTDVFITWKSNILIFTLSIWILLEILFFYNISLYLDVKILEIFRRFNLNDFIPDWKHLNNFLYNVSILFIMSYSSVFSLLKKYPFYSEDIIVLYLVGSKYNSGVKYKIHSSSEEVYSLPIKEIIIYYFLKSFDYLISEVTCSNITYISNKEC